MKTPVLIATYYELHGRTFCPTVRLDRFALCWTDVRTYTYMYRYTRVLKPPKQKVLNGSQRSFASLLRCARCDLPVSERVSGDSLLVKLVF